MPFNRPFVTGREESRLREALERGYTGGNGPIGAACERLLTRVTGAARVLLTHSGTGALEMAAILAAVGPGDEVIMPSFTFVSTANAFVLRGATPVFVDIDATLALDPERTADAVSERTRGIVPVHYGGGAAAIDAIMPIARDVGGWVIEDAAQGAFAAYRGRALGSLGQLGALSFHETKNLSCGEGGALLVNDPALVDRAEIVQEKGTNRLRFVRGEVPAYTWVDIGSSFLMNELTAAVLLGQLDLGEAITAARRLLWQAYHEAFADAETEEVVTRPLLAPDVHHNGHIYYLLARDRRSRDRAISGLAEQGIAAHFHYVPLHSSSAGLRYGRAHGELRRTEDVAGRLVRLPMWVGLTAADVDRIATLTLRLLR